MFGSKPFKPVPTLKGLAVRTENPRIGRRSTQIYPWNQVVILGGRWNIFDRKGNEIREDGRPLRFFVSDDRQVRLARAAQARQFRREWIGGRFELTERYNRSRGDAFFLPIMLILLGLQFVAMFIWFYMKFFGGDIPHQLDSHYGVLIWIVIVLWWILPIAAISFAFHLIFSGITRPNVIAARFDNSGAWVRFRNAAEANVRWDDLEDIRGPQRWAFLCFSNRQPMRFWLNQNPRTRIALEVIRDDLRPDLSNLDMRSQQRSIFRAGLLAIVGGLLVGALFLLFGREDLATSHRYLAVTALVLAHAAAGVAIIVGDRCKISMKRWWREHRPKRSLMEHQRYKRRKKR